MGSKTSSQIEILSELESPTSIFKELGGLHDAQITGFEWLSQDQMLKVSVDDIYSNYCDLPSYPGLTPATLVFFDVRYFDRLTHAFDPEFPLWIVDVSVNRQNARDEMWKIMIVFNNGERLSWLFARMRLCQAAPT